MATIATTSDFDVADKYDTLVKQSLAGDSAYIRAKETIQDLVDAGNIDKAQQAEIIANVISNISNTITTSSMNTAMAWANAEKDFALKKLELEKQLDILDQEKLLKTEQVTQVQDQVKLARVESFRMYGDPTFDPGTYTVASLDNSGKIYEDIQLVKAQELKVDSEKSLTDQKLNESYAAVHKIIADTYMNFGHYTYSGVSSGGVTTVSKQHTHTTLSDTQQDIAKEQAKGYVYNAWANALTGSASMLGTAIASDYAEFGAGQPGGILLDTVLATASNLKAATTTTNEATPV